MYGDLTETGRDVRMIFLDIFRTLRTDSNENGENFEGLHNIFIDILAVYKDIYMYMSCVYV